MPPLAKINKSTANDIAARLRAMAPHYAPGWSARDEGDPGVGLLQVFSFLAEGVISRLNRAPKRNFIAFLDMLGIRRLPATSARVPIRFLMSQGEEEAVRVPEKTRATAAAVGERPEFPFETEDRLLAIPGGLTALIAVDPIRDHIYKPPPGFLDLSVSAAEVPAYTLEAFSSKDSSSFQLQLVDGLQENDILELTSAEVRTINVSSIGLASGDVTELEEFVVIKKVKGRIVTVTEPLKHDYGVGSRARKVTHFELLRGKNLQEHMLYLAHSKLFNLKSAARFELEVSRAPGTPPTTLPLSLEWEYWGEVEGEEDGDEKEQWQPLVPVSDTTNGFENSGRLTLGKLPGEIKEKEVDGKKSRWLRAHLAENQLDGEVSPNLPQLESVKLRVSTDTEIKAEQGFHNDTPLDVTQEFHPFGVEPRIFDRFYIASAEAFSKTDAYVKIHADLDTTGLIGPPAAIQYGDEIRVFACGATGQLLEFRVNPLLPDRPGFYRHPPLSGSRIVEESIPAVCLDATKTKIGVFVRADDGQIHLDLYTGNENQWQPFNLGAPEAEKTPFDPAVAFSPNDGMWEVFVVSDGQLYSCKVHPTNPSGPSDWDLKLTKAPKLPEHPLTPSVNSTPFVALPLNTTPDSDLWVFVTDQNHQTWYWDNEKWTKATPTPDVSPDDVAAADQARPFAFRTRDGAIVFLRNGKNRLVVFRTTDTRGHWLAPADFSVSSDPYAVVRTGSDRKHIFVRDSINQLWSIEEEAKSWQPHRSHPDALLTGNPIAIVWSTRENLFSVFSASNKNSLLELRQRDVHLPADKLEAGPQRVFLVFDDGTGDKNPQRTDYIYITGGEAKSEFRQIEEVRTSLQMQEDDTFLRTSLAIVKPAWSKPPKPDSRYQLLRYKEEEQVTGATRETIKLPPDTRAEENDFVIAGTPMQIRQLGKLKKENTKEKEFAVTERWSAPLPRTGAYTLLRAKHSLEAIRIGSDRFVILSQNAQTQDKSHNGHQLLITNGPGASAVPKKILKYLGPLRLAQVDSPFLDSYPTEESSYQILFNDETWSLYEDPSQSELNPELSWEYWNGNGWVRLEVSDNTHRILNSGDIIFSVPPDLAKTEVAGQDNYWIRARIVGGDYGRETVVQGKDGKLEIRKDTIRPPLINELTIAYELTTYEDPEYCVTFNSLSYVDQTAANNIDNKFFLPFTALPDSGPTLYFGFSKSFKGDPVRLFCAAQELPEASNPPKLAWEFSAEHEWKKLAADDDTHAFTQPEIVSLSLPDKLHKRFEFGESLHWVRATAAREDQWKASPRFAGIFVNSTWAKQAETVRDEILGGSSAEADQQFNFSKGSILEGEEVRVREVLTEEERRILVEEEGQDAVVAITDLRVPTAGDQQAPTFDRQMNEWWVRWCKVQNFSSSSDTSRHYTLDRATGQLQFGDGIHGRIPPAGGDNIRAFLYQSGGGAEGNVAAGDITALVTAIAGVDSVINPIAAGGGSDEASTETMLTIGPAQISHRGRAVTSEDFEWLAKEASRQVRRVRCVPNRNKAGRNEVGWVSVYIVPDSLDAQPSPSLQLQERVRRYLADRADLTVANQNQIYVDKPTYVVVHVEVSVCAKSIDVVADAERKAQEKLTKYLHPLTGGRGGDGWEFGQGVAVSELYLLLEEIPEVDHVEELRLSTDEGDVDVDKLDIDRHTLIASGEHVVSVTVASGS